MVSRRSRDVRSGSYLTFRHSVERMLKDEQNKEYILDNGANFFSFFSNGVHEKNLHNSKELINKYREYAEITEVEHAIDIITNEAIVSDEDEPVKIKIKKESNIIEDYVLSYLRDETLASFDRVYNILNFSVEGEMLFRRWYVDARLYLYMDFEIGVGLKNVYWLDPLRIKKIKKEDGLLYYRYTFKKHDVREKAEKFVDIPVEFVLFIDSGMIGKEGLIIGPLNKAIRPISSLKMMENSLVISRMSRSPERFVFKIDTKNLDKNMGEQYMRNLMRQYRNRFYIDGTTGEIRGDTSSLALMENFWFSKQQGEGHEVDILRGSAPMSDISDISYFERKGIRSLNVPVSRFEEQKAFNFSSRKDEIDREELDFFKFIKKERKRSIRPIFNGLMKVDLIAQNKIGIEDWKRLVPLIQYDYNNDNKYEEHKKYQELMGIFDKYPQAKEIVEDGYQSLDWFYETVFNMTPDEVIKIKEERKSNLIRLANERHLKIKLGLIPKDDYNEDIKY
jgi:hypothetical protein